jgi:hypothetical protein
VALCKSGKVAGGNVLDRSFINNTWGNVPGSNQVTQPLGRIRIMFIVVSGHF